MTPVGQIGLDGRPYSYAAVTDVAALIPGATFGATSAKPGASQVGHFLDQCSNELDALLASVDYAVPVATGATASIEMLRSWTSIGGAYRTAMAMPQGKDSKHAEAYGKEWTAILGRIEKGKVELPDAPRSPVKVARGGQSGVDCGPTFVRGDARLR